MNDSNAVKSASDYAAVQDLFSQTARQFSSSLAIDNGVRRITYGELETKVQRLTRLLLELGVSSEGIVGIFTNDPIEVISSILATLKAGGVFCPLDPKFPEKRLKVMFESVSPTWCITESQFHKKLKEIASGAISPPQVILVDDGPVDEAEHHVLRLSAVPDLPAKPISHSDPDAPCSIYFTSGSTGRPKAIIGRLKGIDHFARWAIEALGVGHGTRVSQLASPSFDGFLKDAFVPLCAGGVVCAPASRDVVLDPGRLIDWLDVEQVEVLQCVPSLFRSLINEGLHSNYFEAMKYVVLAGEALPPANVKQWMDVFGERIRLLNLYGPTETTIVKVFHFVRPEDTTRASIPLGKPMRGAAVLVVDQHGQPCSVGDIGEIYIRTPYCALGYHSEPALTREVFIPNPFNNDPKDIVYKTGDFGRFTEDGNLEFLGRRDQQIKVRGVRVELGEIENLLRRHDAVADIAVIDCDDADGNKFLVAYVTMSNGRGSEHLRDYLAEHLPEEMLPSAFIELDQLPRTLNGKIDRKALPTVDIMQAQRQLETGRLNPIEEIVAGIWGEVLKVPLVRQTDNFFNLGGHSLLITHAILRVRDILKVELPIRSMFDAPTLSEFCALLQNKINESSQGELSAIPRVSREHELALSYAQQRMWFFEHLASGSASFHIPLGVRMKGRLNHAALEQTFSEIVRRHESLRTIFPAIDDRPAQIIQPPAQFQLPVVDLSRLPREERERVVERLAQNETLRRFDLSKGPFVRPTVMRLDQQEHIVICTMHHIICDGQSFEVLIAEMSQLYGVLREGRPSSLPELTVQYVDYAAWQRQWLQGDVLESRLAYWRRQLANAPQSLSLPQRRTRRNVQTFRGARQEVTLSAELVQELRELTRREGSTLLMTMLAGYVLLVNRYTGDEDIIVGSSYANRDRPEAEKLIGILANTIMLRVNLAGASSFREVMKRVREVCLDAYTYQLSPELLREDLAKRGEERERLFDVWFQLEREEREKLEMEGLECEWYGVHREETKFELSLMLVERKQEITGVFEYDVDLFDDEMIAEMVKSYLRLLKQAVADPDGRF
ncbi:MAG TPA: amino acid adenylation domain-containing protein [Pyrinomonadaceae bacterium]|nr:amino acid adenylation domain-containing protein [Pyrinomonadaceae bacterium]